MTKIGAITVSGREVGIHSVTGDVLAGKKWTTMEISGGGGSGYTHQGSGSSHVAPVRSTTTTHEEIFLRDDGGQEHVIKLTDVGLALRDGHRLTAVWGIKNGKDRGPYVLFINHHTGSVDEVRKTVSHLSGGGWLAILAVITVVAGLLTMFGSMFVGMLIVGGGAYAGFVSRARNKEFRGQLDKISAPLKALSAQPASAAIRAN